MSAQANQFATLDRCLEAGVDFCFDYLPRPLSAVCSLPLAGAIGRLIGLNIVSAPLAAATIIGQVALAIIDKQTQYASYRTLAKCTLKEFVKFVAVVTLSTLTYDFLTGGQLGACSLLVGSALAYAMARIYYKVCEVLLDLFS